MTFALTSFRDLTRMVLQPFIKRPSFERPVESLDTALREAARAYQALLEAFAHAAVAERRDADRLDALNADITALEGRAILAIQGGRQDLAQRAAESLVTLEAQRVAQSAVCAEARTTARELRQRIDADRIRLQKLNHGRTLAKIRAIAPRQPLAHSPLNEAEDLLATINAADTVARLEHQPQQIAQDLAEAGFGPSHQSEVAMMFERLKVAAQLSASPSSIAIDLATAQRPSQL